MNTDECAAFPAGAIAAAFANFLDRGSKRPIYGDIVICRLDPDDFRGDFETVVHELIHAVVRPSATCNCLGV